LDTINLDNYWRKTYGSFLSKAERIRNPHGATSYLAKYVSGEDFVRACFSQNWVFPQWFEFNKWCKRSKGDYLPVAELARLSMMTPAERYTHDDYFQWFLTRQDKIKEDIANKVIGYTERERRMLRNYNKKHSRKVRIP